MLGAGTLVRLRGRWGSGSLTLVRGGYIDVRRGSAPSFFDSTYVPTDIHIDCIFASVPGNNANLVSRNGHQRAVSQTMEHSSTGSANASFLSSSLLGLPPPPPVPPVASFSIFLILYHRLPHPLLPPSSFATATSAFFVRQAASYGGRRHNDGQTSNLKLLTESWVLWSSAPGRPTSGAASRFTSRWSLLWPRCRLVLSFSFRRLARARCFCRIESQTAKRCERSNGSTFSFLFSSFCFLPILLVDFAFSTNKAR